MIPNTVTPDDLERLAAEFCARPGTLPSYYTRVHRRAGEIAATNGCVLLHVHHPLVVAADGAHPPVFDLAPPTTPALAGPEWIAGPLADAVRPAMHAVRERLPRLLEDFRRRAETSMTVRTCPCCGQTMWEDEDGDLHDPDDYVDENAPDEESVAGGILLRCPDGCFTRVLVRSLDLALRAADLLGGATALRYDGRMLVSLEGEGWYVVMASEHRLVGDAGLEIDLPPAP